MISRRAFSKNLVCSLGMAAQGQSYSQNSTAGDFVEDLLIGGGRYIDLETGDERFVLSLIETTAPHPTLIPLDFYPHGIAVKPDSSNELLVMEKKGAGCALIDINSKEVLLDLSASKDCWFYGHGVYAKDSAHLYIVETDLNTHKGLLSIRDTETGKILGEMDSHGANPHDCLLIENGDVLAITNAGLEKGSADSNSAPCVTYVDANSGKLLEKIPLTNTDINAGHLLVTEDSDLAVVSAPRDGFAPSALGGVSLRPAGIEMKSLTAPLEITSQLVGETLSLAYHEDTGVIAATTPDANLVTFWKMEDRSLLFAAKLQTPRGVCLSSDQNYFLVSAGDIPMIYSIDTRDLSNINPINQNAYISGSHLYNWSVLTST